MEFKIISTLYHHDNQLMTLSLGLIGETLEHK